MNINDILSIVFNDVVVPYNDPGVWKFGPLALYVSPGANAPQIALTNPGTVQVAEVGSFYSIHPTIK